MSEAAVLAEIENAIAEKRFNDAQNLFNQVLGEYPHSFQVNLQYALFLQKVGRLEDAREKLLDLNRKNFGNLIVLRELTNLAIIMQDYQQAEIYVEQMLFFDAFNKEARDKQKEIQELKLNAVEIKLEDTQDDFAFNPFGARKEQLPSTPPEEFEAISIKMSEVESGSKDNSMLVKKVENNSENLPQIIEQKNKQDDFSDILLKEKSAISNLFELNRQDETSEKKLIKREIILDKEEKDYESKPVKQNVDQAVPVAEPFITVSTAELYLRQGQTNEALFIYQQLYERNPEPDYLIKINELKKLYKQEKSLQVSEKLLLFLKIAQKRAKNNVL